MHLLKTKYFDYLLALCLYLGIALLILGSILLSPGTVGFFHDWFIGPYPEMNRSWANNGLYLWDSQSGSKLYPTDWIIRLSLFPFTFLGGEILSKGLLIISVTLSGFGAFCLGRQLKLSSYVSFAIGILYIFSPIIFTRIVAGYVYYLIAYFLGPLIVASFLKGKEENNRKYFVIAALLLSFATIHLQFFIMLFLILVIFSVMDLKYIKRSIYGLVLIFFISSLITLSPLVLSQLTSKSNESSFNPTQLLSYFTLVTASDLAESFRILGYQGMPYSYLNLGTINDPLVSNAGVMPPWIFYLDFLFPIIGYSVLLFRRDKYTISFAIISIIGLYFMKGGNSPFSSIFAFFFTHGFYIFREVWHVAFLYSLSITFLVAYFIEWLWRLNVKQFLKVPLLASLVVMIVISNGYPLLLGNFAGYLQTYTLPNEYRSLYNNLLSDDQYNVLILPYVTPIRYDSLRLEGVDPLVSYSPAMIFASELANRGSPTLAISLWLLTTMQENKTQDLGNLLSGLGINYIVLRKDFVSNYPDYATVGSLQSFREKWYTPLAPLLNMQKDMKKISETKQYAIYQNLNNASKIFSPTVSAGGLSDFNTLLSVTNLTSLSNFAAYPNISDNNTIIFLDDTSEKNMPLNDFFSLGKYSNTYDPSKGWIDNRMSFGYDSILTSRVNEGVFTTNPNSEITFTLPSKYDNKKVEIWMKALLWNQGSTVGVLINGEKHEVSLFSPFRSFHLLKIFEGESDVPYGISIQNKYGSNYIEGLYVKDIKYPQLNHFNKNSLTIITNETGNNLISNAGFSLFDNQSKLPFKWSDLLDRCHTIFICKINSTDGWDDKLSFQLSTQNNTNRSWSWIVGKEIYVQPSDIYELVTHMKLNNWVRQSHVALEGYNQTSQHWRQITQCPPGTDGPLEWSLRICKVSIPEKINKIRPVLNAGWSSLPDKEATTWFDGIYVSHIIQRNEPSNVDRIKNLISVELLDNKTSIKMNHTKIEDFHKVSPSTWNLHINTTKPTTIAFAEPYHQGWEAIIYKAGKKIDTAKSMPLYGVINAFDIKHTGDLEIVLSFVPQHWYQVGITMSGITFILCITYIIYGLIRRKIKI